MPFLCVWFLTFPLVRSGFLFAESRAGGVPSASTWAGALEQAGSGLVFAGANPIHLWFLEYLIIYYALTLAVLGATRPGRRWRSAMERLTGGAAGPAVLTAAPLMASPIGLIPTPLSFLPEPVSFVAHGIAFAAGWALHGRAETLRGLGRRAGMRLVLGLALLPVAGMALRLRCLVLPPDAFGPLPPGAELALSSGHVPSLPMAPGSMAALAAGLAAQAVLACSSALTTWLLVFGVTGLFVRYCARPIGWVRYLADASYWLYLAHFPLMVWIPIALGGLELPALSKLSLVVAISMTSLLAIREAGHLVLGGQSAWWGAVRGRLSGRPPSGSPPPPARPGSSYPSVDPARGSNGPIAGALDQQGQAAVGQPRGQCVVAVGVVPSPLEEIPNSVVDPPACIR